MKSRCQAKDCALTRSSPRDWHGVEYRHGHESVGTAVGAALYAVVSDRFFQGPMTLAYSMSLVVGILDALAIIFYLLMVVTTRRARSLVFASESGHNRVPE